MHNTENALVSNIFAQELIVKIKNVLDYIIIIMLQVQFLKEIEKIINSKPTSERVTNDA